MGENAVNRRVSLKTVLLRYNIIATKEPHRQMTAMYHQRWKAWYFWNLLAPVQKSLPKSPTFKFMRANFKPILIFVDKEYSILWENLANSKWKMRNSKIKFDFLNFKVLILNCFSINLQNHCRDSRFAINQLQRFSYFWFGIEDTSSIQNATFKNKLRIFGFGIFDGLIHTQTNQANWLTYLVIV